MLSGELQWKTQHGIPLGLCMEKVKDHYGHGKAAVNLMGPGGAVPVPPQPAHGSMEAQSLMAQLRELMAWRRDGLLSESQFESAKVALGLV